MHGTSAKRGAEMKRVMICCCLALIAAAGPERMRFLERQMTELTIQLVDDTGQPVIGARVVTDCYDRPPNEYSISDSNGTFWVRDHVNGALTCHVTKDGYYRTRGQLWRGPVYGEEVPPTNVYSVVLKRIMNPVTMLSREVTTHLPSLEKPCGFDLLAADWVRPHGTGVVADCQISGKKTVEDNRNWDWSCQVSFTNADGVVKHQAPGKTSSAVRSELIPPQVAPEEGYVHGCSFEESFHTGKINYESSGANDHFLFRVRTTTNVEGRVTSANVGWLEGPIQLDGRKTKTLWLRFQYHLNPNRQSRSLEPERMN